MKKFFKQYYPVLISYFISAVLGVLFHFLHDWFPNINFIKPFVAIDESIFEHLKLIFYPVIFVSIFEAFIRKRDLLSLISARNLSSLIACLQLTLFYYGYTMLTNGKPISWLNILSFFVFLAISYIGSEYFYFKFNNNKYFLSFSLTLFIIAILLFSIFTFYKPNFELFLEPKVNEFIFKLAKLQLK